MGKVKRSVQLALFYNETSQLCQWHVPQAHYLESWSDARPSTVRLPSSSR